MPGIDYRAWFDGAKAELDRLRQQRAEVESHKADIDRKIAALVQVIRTLAPIVGEKPDPTFGNLLLEAGKVFLSELGMTEGIRRVLQSSSQPLSPTEVRDRLAHSGLDLSGYANPLSSIHTILKRLVDRGELTELAAGAGQSGRRYRWRGSTTQ